MGAASPGCDPRVAAAPLLDDVVDAGAGRRSAMSDVSGLRRDLHRHPELSGDEAQTARRIQAFFAPLRPDAVVTGLGGHGLAFVFDGAAPGPTVLLRCELDALPIAGEAPVAWRSQHAGVGHQCGHDGHMAILAAVGARLAARRPPRGRVVLLYQPAEENGQGAAAVIADERFRRLVPDYAFAVHNLPGVPFGEVVVRSGEFTAASRGMAVRLTGATAHAAQPETGRNPTAALCRIIGELSSIPGGVLPRDERAFATVVGARLGEKAFGTAPGDAELWATLRAETDGTMTRLVAYAQERVAVAAAAAELGFDVAWEDVFPATVNSRRAVDLVRRAAGPAPVVETEGPFAWSEDFGRYTQLAEGALFGIGAGTETAPLHDPRYDYPDALTPVAAAIFCRIVDQCLAAQDV